MDKWRPHCEGGAHPAVPGPRSRPAGRTAHRYVHLHTHLGGTVPHIVCGPMEISVHTFFALYLVLLFFQKYLFYIVHIYL